MKERGRGRRGEKDGKEVVHVAGAGCISYVCQ